MATITLDPGYHDPAGLDIPSLGLHLEAGGAADVDDETARGFLSHPDIAVAGLPGAAEAATVIS